MSVANPKKGINFKQTPNKKMMLIHPETFTAFLGSLPVQENGWVSFDFRLLGKLTRTSLFAEIEPTTNKVYSATAANRPYTPAGMDGIL